MSYVIESWISRQAKTEDVILLISVCFCSYLFDALMKKRLSYFTY